MSPRLWLVVILALAGAFAPSRVDARGAETCAQGFLATATTARPQPESQVAGTHQGFAAWGYELASGYSQAAENAGAATYDDLVAAAQDAYPGKAGDIELHHITPKYLGGDPDGPLVPLDAAYHQQITNEFRNLWPYGGPQPSPAQLEEIMQQVYQKYPLPPGTPAPVPVTVGPGG
jgi:hypothetical protein